MPFIRNIPDNIGKHIIPSHKKMPNELGSWNRTFSHVFQCTYLDLLWRKPASKNLFIKVKIFQHHSAQCIISSGGHLWWIINKIQHLKLLLKHQIKTLQSIPFTFIQLYFLKTLKNRQGSSIAVLISLSQSAFREKVILQFQELEAGVTHGTARFIVLPNASRNRDCVQLLPRV